MTTATLAEQLRDLGVTVKVLTVGEDETVVLEFGEKATAEQADAIRRAWLDASLPERVALIGGGVKVGAVRYEDAQEPA